MSNQNQESSRLSTLRFSFPEGVIANVQNMKIIGRDILLYVQEESCESITKSMQEMGLETVERVYKLHASAQDEATFKSALGDIVHEVRDSAGRYIATITLDSKDEYDRILSLNSESCFVKPFKARYSAVRRFDGDEQSDTNDNVQRHQRDNTQKRPYQKVQRDYTQRDYTQRDHTQRDHTQRDHTQRAPRQPQDQRDQRDQRAPRQQQQQQDQRVQRQPQDQRTQRNNNTSRQSRV
jgi:hypothetical protein